MFFFFLFFFYSCFFIIPQKSVMEGLFIKLPTENERSLSVHKRIAEAFKLEA